LYYLKQNVLTSYKDLNHFIEFTASYPQKLHVTFESNNPETFKVATKFYLDYSEKLENINRAVVDPSIFDESKESLASKRILRESAIKKGILTIRLHREVCKIRTKLSRNLQRFPSFLKPRRAATFNESTEYVIRVRIVLRYDMTFVFVSLIRFNVLLFSFLTVSQWKNLSSNT